MNNKFYQTILFYIFLLFNLFVENSYSQCTISSTCGYTIQVNITATEIIPTTTECPFGFNYNVRFNYSITVTGVNTCFNGDIGIQPNILCNSSVNSRPHIIVPAPTLGVGPVTTSYTGIGITTSSQYSSLTSCNPAPSPSVFGCNGLTLSLYGPGLSGNSQCGLILPVNLKFFAESCWQGERIFKWETASEKNNDFFSLEGSNDGKSWSSFKNIKGAINSNSVQEYSYIDKSKISLNYKYFRLSQFDIDGKSSHSPLIFASSCTDLNTEIQIFPSPGSQFISVRMPLENRQNIKGWEIRDLMAKPVITGISLQEQLDISKLANGIYFLIINTIDYPSFSSKFIVVNN